MDTQRLILFFIFGFSLLMLWDAWEKENRPKPDRKSTRLNSSHIQKSRMPSSA